MTVPCMRSERGIVREYIAVSKQHQAQRINSPRPQCLLTCHVSLKPELKDKRMLFYSDGYRQGFSSDCSSFCSFISLLEAHSLSESTITLKPREWITKNQAKRWSCWRAVPPKGTMLSTLEIFAVLPTRLAQLALRPRSCRQAWSHFYSATWAMDGPECHALIPYLRHQDLLGPPQFLEGCAQLGRDTPGWSLFSAKSLLRYQINLIVRSRTQREHNIMISK